MNIRPFIDFLREHGRGETHDKLSDMLHELVEAVATENRKASMTITITMKPIEKTGAFELIVNPALKLPKRDGDSSLFYVTPDNNLTKSSPQQILDLPGGPTLIHKGIA